MSTLKPVDRMYLERLFEMGSGYVLSFSNATFEDFIRGSTGEDIYSDAYSDNGESKANRLRAFRNTAPNDKVAALLVDLRTLMIDNEKVTNDGPEAARLEGIIADLGGQRSVTPGREPTSPAPRPPARTAFVSYSVEKKIAGGAVKECLGRFGYECFLAHEDLHVSEEWKHRILEELGTADVFVALLSKEFMASKWCGQELGFIVSRPAVLVVPLSLDGTMPYGFIEHLQGIRVDGVNLAAVLEEVLYRKRPRQMIPAQIERVRSAGSFRGAEAVVRPLMPHFAQFTDQEVDDFARAAAGILRCGTRGFAQASLSRSSPG
jgi:TIR domain-containing protein